MADFAFQVVVTVMAAAAWHTGGWRRHVAAVVFVTAGLDGLLDIPEFYGSGDVLATLIEVGWVTVACLVIRHYWRTYVQLEHR